MVYNQIKFIFILSLLILASCSVNPFRTDNQLTGSATGTAVGAGAGAVTAAVAGASKAEILMAGILGGFAGYYVTSLDFASGGVNHVGGQVFTLGDYTTIEIPSDVLFDVNSSEFLPEATPVLDSVVSVLNRSPNCNIMISGNTSGFYTNKFERKLSEARARQVAAYLWAHGVNNFAQRNSNVGGIQDNTYAYMRKLNYVGYGSSFPIANNITAQGIRQNSRIQITVYPTRKSLRMYKADKAFKNMGDSDDESWDNAIKSNNGDLADVKGEMSDSYQVASISRQTNVGAMSEKQGGDTGDVG